MKANKTQSAFSVFLISLLLIFTTNCGGGGGGDSSGSTTPPQSQPAVPSAPQGVTATAGNGQVTVSWNQVAGATSYNIYWSRTGGVTKNTGTKISAMTSPYLHAPLDNNTTYYYVVTAVSISGESADSPQVSATPSAPVNKVTTALFVGPDSALKGATVTFDASASSSPNGAIASYSFDFGESGPSVTQTSPVFTHTYAISGTYSVTLSVTDTSGTTVSTSKEITIGMVLSQPVNVSNTAGWSQGQSFAIDGQGAINVAWQEDGGDILFSRSVDGGKTFSAPKAVMTRLSNYNSDQIRLVNTNSGTILISWTLFDTVSGGAEVLFSSSSDGGSTFSSPVIVSTVDNVNSYTPSIATDGNNRIGIVWDDANLNFENTKAVEGIFYGRSDDNGSTFFQPKIILRQDGTPSTSGTSCPDIAISSQNIYVTWPMGPSEGDIYFSRSTDGGTTFSAPIDIPNYPAKSWCPHMGLDSAGNIYVVWDEGSALTKNRYILFSQSTDKGLSFSRYRYLSTLFPDSFCSNIAVSDAGTIFVTWSTGDFNNNTHKSFLVYSSDSGKTFSAPLKIPVITGQDACPSIAAKGLNQISFVWSGPFKLPVIPSQSSPVPNATLDKPDIFYSSGIVSIP